MSQGQTNVLGAMAGTVVASARGKTAMEAVSQQGSVTSKSAPSMEATSGANARPALTKAIRTMMSGLAGRPWAVTTLNSTSGSSRHASDTAT